MNQQRLQHSTTLVPRLCLGTTALEALPPEAGPQAQCVPRQSLGTRHGLASSERRPIKEGVVFPLGNCAMKIHEYQAKELLAAAGAAVPRGIVAASPAAAQQAFQRMGAPVVLKA